MKPRVGPNTQAEVVKIPLVFSGTILYRLIKDLRLVQKRLSHNSSQMKEFMQMFWMRTWKRQAIYCELRLDILNLTFEVLETVFRIIGYAILLLYPIRKFRLTFGRTK